jgi:hypothetical protein
MLAGCEKVAVVIPRAAPYLVSEDSEIAQTHVHLVTYSEIAMSLRGGSSQQAIIKDIKERHIAGTPTPREQEQLVTLGAGPELMATLSDRQNFATGSERVAEAIRVAKQARAKQAYAAEASKRALTAAEEHEQEIARRKRLQQEGFRLIEERKQKQEAYEAAVAAYDSKRKALQAQAETLGKATYGSVTRGNSIAGSSNQGKIEEVNKKLSELTPPTPP